MPKQTAPRKVGTSSINNVPVELFELDAKTKDADGKETRFTYQFPAFRNDVSHEQLVSALTYTDSKKVVHSGHEVLVDYVNTALKNEKRSSKLAEINGALKVRENPEAAIEAMIQTMVIGMGVRREIAEANIRAIVAQGVLGKPQETPAGATA